MIKDYIPRGVENAVRLGIKLGLLIWGLNIRESILGLWFSFLTMVSKIPSSTLWDDLKYLFINFGKRIGRPGNKMTQLVRRTGLCLLCDLCSVPGQLWITVSSVECELNQQAGIA